MNLRIDNNLQVFGVDKKTTLKANNTFSENSINGLANSDSLNVTKKNKLPFDFEIHDEKENLTLKTERTLEELPDFTKTPLRIGIVVAQKQANFTIPNGNVFIETKEGKKEIGSFNDLTTITVKNENNKIAVYDEKGKALGIFDEGTLKVENNISPIAINGKKYRGDLNVVLNPADNATLNIVNNVMVEDYLRGVVPSESSASWPIESLKAQTLAARTYAISNWNRRESLGFDLMATTSDQVYNGMAVEHPATDQAIKETTGEIMLYNGKPINALFFSCSGGYTDSAKEVWKEPNMPYIQPVPDFDQKAPRYKWTQTFNNSDIQKGLTKLGVDAGNVKNIEIIEKTEHNRATKLRITGSKGTFEVDGNKFRLAVGLNSTFFTIKKSSSLTKKLLTTENPTSFVFNGGGWGHGLGMSQWGARQMAEDGKNYNEIVKHYYTGITLGNLDK
ncbi:MAG: SpoIID/LytB domain-containing protein [Candidatus Sericytochromatia bacterium]